MFALWLFHAGTKQSLILPVSNDVVIPSPITMIWVKKSKPTGRNLPSVASTSYATD